MFNKLNVRMLVDYVLYLSKILTASYLFGLLQSKGLICLEVFQGSCRLEKYLNIQDCLEKSLNFTICKRIQHCFLET